MLKRVQILFLFILIIAAHLSISYFWEGWFAGWFSIIISFSTIFIAFVIFLENRNPSRTLTWLVVLGAFPIIGFIFYLLFGQNHKKRKSYFEKAKLDEQALYQIEGNKPVDRFKIGGMPEHQMKLFKLAHHLTQSQISFQSYTKVLTDGKETFTYIKEALKRATSFIHLEYYIVRDDELGKEIKKILLDKLKEGVEVRFLYDDVGCWKLNSSYMRELNAAGAKTHAFAPVRLPLLNNRMNFRNHRKIIIIDMDYAFIGGLNIGDEYLGKNPYFGHWRDTHLMVTGEAVRNLQLIFMRDWFYSANEILLEPHYLSPELPERTDDGAVQMIASGPDTKFEIIKKMFFAMINSAKKSIWIASPYLIPDEDILTAIKISALSGVDVRILMPNKPDKRIVFYASRSYYPELLEAGVKIYEYNRGFMHSKLIIVDHEIASIGTANMDMRSFHLNFEANVFLYKTESIEKLVADYIFDMEHSKIVSEKEFKKRSLFTRFVESTSRLVSPLL